MVTIINDFITHSEESDLLSHIKPASRRNEFLRNRVLRYGSSLPYEGPRVSKEIPKWLHEICFRVAQEWAKIEHIHGRLPNHVTINEYLENQTIEWHIDSKRSGPIISVISLLSEAVMGLRGKEQTTHILPPRSLLHLTGDDRWEKEHCIYPLVDTRYSLVFRKGEKINLAESE